MSDYLVNLSEHKQVTKMIKNLGIPIPLPQKLNRSNRPWSNDLLKHQKVWIGGPKESVMTHSLFECLKEFSATPYLFHQDDQDFLGESLPNALVYNTCSFSKLSDLKKLYEFIHNNIQKVSNGGRIILIGHLPKRATLEQSTIAKGVEGFVRALSKEVGKFGQTANLIITPNKRPQRIKELILPSLVYLLSNKSSFITGQIISLRDDALFPHHTHYERPLHKRNILLTGAVRGIGRVTSYKLAKEGATLYLLDRPEDRQELKSLAQELNAFDIPMDLMNQDTPYRLTDYFKQEKISFDGIIHNAGITRDKTIPKMPENYWEEAMRVNLESPYEINQELFNNNLINDHARIICLSSVSGVAGNFGQTNYSCAKAALVGYIQHCSHKHLEKGITFNAIAPGLIETRLTQKIPFLTREVGRRISNLRQGGVPEDVADLITYLSFPQSAGLNGQVIRVCGGHLMGA